jgi:hypothetical protein
MCFAHSNYESVTCLCMLRFRLNQNILCLKMALAKSKCISLPNARIIWFSNKFSKVNILYVFDIIMNINWLRRNYLTQPRCKANSCPENKVKWLMCQSNSYYNTRLSTGSLTRLAISCHNWFSELFNSISVIVSLYRLINGFYVPFPSAADTKLGYGGTVIEI